MVQSVMMWHLRETLWSYQRKKTHQKSEWTVFLQ